MLGLGGVASNGWDTLSALQAQQLANAGAAAAGIGAGQFAPGSPNGPAVPAGTPPFTLAPAGSISQTSLSPDVLGFLIWNQSQQSAGPTGAAGSPTTEAGTAANAGSAGPAGAGGTDGTTPFPTLTPLQALFSQLTAGNTINQSELQTPLNGNAVSVTGPMPPANSPTTGEPTADPNGAVTQASAAHWHHHHHMDGGGQAQSGQSDPLASLFGTSADGATTSTATNADGSTTTTITYADGSEITMTTPVQASSAGPTPAAGAAAAQPPAPAANALETLIQLQARLLAPSASA